MPVLSGSALRFTICDIANCAIQKVENRTTDLVRAQEWVRDALLEITSNPDFRDEFDELETMGPVFNLTIGQQEYSFDNLFPTGDLIVATLDLLLWQDPPLNTLRKKLREANYQEIDKVLLSSNLALPSSWYRFGNDFGVYPLPDQAYQVRARIYYQHPINDNDLCNTVILLPRDWLEVLCYAAAERGFIELLEYEKAAQIHTLLHGDPKEPRRPGLFYGRKKRRERENWRESAALRPVIRSYNWGRGR
jgi:hypothetical protein